MHLIAKSSGRAKFHCSRLTTVQDIQDYESLIFLAHSVVLASRTRKHCVSWL